MTHPKGNPQLEHGHTRLANELLEALIRDLLAGLRQQGVVFRDRVARPHTYRLNKAYFGWRDWPPTDEPALCTQATQAACELAGSPAQLRTFAPVPWDRVYKEKKENVLPPSHTGDVDNPSVVENSPAVESLLHRFTTLLKRSLTTEEAALVRRLHELSPTQAQQLLDQLAAAQPPPYHHPEAPQASHA